MVSLKVDQWSGERKVKKCGWVVEMEVEFGCLVSLLWLMFNMPTINFVVVNKFEMFPRECDSDKKRVFVFHAELFWARNKVHLKKK